MPRDNLLMVGSSERDANLLHAVGLFLSDPFIYLHARDQCYTVVSDFEFDRVRKRASHCTVLSLTELQRKVARNGIQEAGWADVIHHLLRSLRLKKVTIPETFPVGIAKDLKELGIKLKIAKEPVFPSREHKSPADVKKISAALTMAEVGLSEAMLALKRSRIGRNKKLYYRDVVLTAEKLRAIIETAIVQAGGCCPHTIVSCGRQTADPHEMGHGPLRAHQPIILDVFPRSKKTGFYADITRTVVRGHASESVRKIYHTVLRAQEVAFAELRKGTTCTQVHQSVIDFFDLTGLKTGRNNGKMEGFFHGLGHGVGLEIHEPPKLHAGSREILQPGHVVTVEPGLYYAGVGGVRLEDMALITEHSSRNLTRFEKVLEL